MGNCGACNRDSAPQQPPVLTKQDRIQQFEDLLPFKSLYIDEFESLVMAVAKIQKINNEYQPSLSTRNCQLRRIVKYFKGIDEFNQLQDAHSKLTGLLKSIFLSSETYKNEDESAQSRLHESMSSGAKSNDGQSMGTNNTVFENVPIDIDTECFLLLGLLFCRDRHKQKASIFYSLLRGSVTKSNRKIKGSSNQDQNFQELHCMDEAIESTIFKLCILSSMFTEYHALPARPGKTEIKMLHMAFAMRTSVFFAVFQTFIQHVWSEAQEQFYVSRDEFVDKMSEYPLSHFLQASTFRKMIALRMPETAEGIVKRKKRVIESVVDSHNMGLMESQSRPNLGKYSYQASIYEKSEREMNKSVVNSEYNREMALMLASTKSQEENFFPSQPAGQDDYDDNGQYPEVGRSPSFMAPKERLAKEFDDTLDFKQNSGQWTSSNSQSLTSGSGTGSGSRSGRESGTSSEGLQGSLASIKEKEARQEEELRQTV